MSVTVAGMASSHAYTFSDPADWEMRRKRTRARYKSKYGSEPAEVESIASETLEANTERFTRITDGLKRLKAEFEAFRPDVLVLLGDDQDEHYREDIPQFAIYTGDEFVSVDRDSGSGVRETYRNDPALAEHVYAACVDAGFDLVGSKTFSSGELISHAHAQIISYLDPQVPVVPIFVNAIHVPAPSPARCLAFGRALRDALGSFPGNLRVAVYASGGLSHFSAGFPYPAYKGPYGLGAIAKDFDHKIFAWMNDGQNAKLGQLTSDALLDNGEVELRQWIMLMGVLGDRKPGWLVYEAFFRAIMGMGVGFWSPFDVTVAAPALAH
jgi:aromatic ring-opening dioxygenase LigB subunit